MGFDIWRSTFKHNLGRKSKLIRDQGMNRQRDVLNSSTCGPKLEKTGPSEHPGLLDKTKVK